MRRNIVISMAAVFVFLAGTRLAFTAGNHKYVGVKKCAMCHKSETRGNQYGQWLSTKHSMAYKVLGTDKAKKAAQKEGVSGDPQQAPECLKCHMTAFGVDEALLDLKFNKEDGVQCESCHGAGGDYKSLSIMKDKAKAIEAGLIMPTKDVCLGCHNEKSPNFTGFDFDEYYSRIAHPVPK